jgi:hypothetical protein
VSEFGAYLQQRWNEGCHNATRLYHEIRDRGYAGKRAMVARFVAGWRKTGKATRSNAPERISPKHAAILVTRAADQMTDEQQRLFDRITSQCPEVADLRRIALSFRAALTGINLKIAEEPISRKCRSPGQAEVGISCVCSSGATLYRRCNPPTCGIEIIRPVAGAWMGRAPRCLSAAPVRAARWS